MRKTNRIKQVVSSLNIIDDTFFQNMAEDIGFCEELLSMILEQKIVVENVPTVISIFVSKFDMFNQKKTIYHVERVDQEIEKIEREKCMIDYKYIETIIRTAGSIMKTGISESQIHTKGRADFVTDKDMEVQQYLYHQLHESYPRIGFIGEEKSDYEQTSADMHWIVDPIDGTTNYIYGYNMSAISLALKQKEEIIFGIVYNPFTDELFRAEKGQGAYLNDRKINVSDKTSLYDSLVAVGTSPYHKHMARSVFEKIRSIYENALDIRRTGSAALDLAYVACGRQDAYFEYNLKPWDYAAGFLLVTEAGGMVRQTDNKEIVHGKNSNVLACCHEAVLEEIATILEKAE